MEKALILLIIGYIFLAIVVNDKDECTHLTGIAYDRCHFAQVKGR